MHERILNDLIDRLCDLSAVLDQRSQTYLACVGILQKEATAMRVGNIDAGFYQPIAHLLMIALRGEGLSNGVEPLLLLHLVLEVLLHALAYSMQSPRTQRALYGRVECACFQWLGDDLADPKLERPHVKTC